MCSVIAWCPGCRGDGHVHLGQGKKVPGSPRCGSKKWGWVQALHLAKCLGFIPSFPRDTYTALLLPHKSRAVFKSVLHLCPAGTLFHQVGKEILATGLKIVHIISSCFSSDAPRERLVYQDIKQKHSGKGDLCSSPSWEPLRRVFVYKCIRLWLSSLWT